MRQTRVYTPPSLSMLRFWPFLALLAVFLPPISKYGIFLIQIHIDLKISEGKLVDKMSKFRNPRLGNLETGGQKRYEGRQFRITEKWKTVISPSSAILAITPDISRFRKISDFHCFHFLSENDQREAGRNE